MATCVFYDPWFDDVMEGVHTLGSNTLKLVLSNTTPNAADDQLSDVTQITGANGYTTGGETLTSVTSTQTSGTYTLSADPVIFTASGGTMGTFRYITLYNDSATNDELICYWDHGSTVSLTDTQTYTITFGSGNVFTFTTDA